MRLKSQRLEDLAAYEQKLRESHQDSPAELVKYVMGEYDLALQEFFDEPLTITKAREWGGYTCSQLNKLVKDGGIRTDSKRRIRRRNVPVRPGHEYPLDLQPTEDTPLDFTARLTENRRRATNE